LSAISGVVLPNGRPVTAQFLENFAAAAARRGFDGTDLWFDGPVGLVRQAHATTPEAVGEQQPFVAESGNVLCFDGRLDNRDELLTLLGNQAGALKSAPDGQIALALFEQRGQACLKVLTGDWALAIWQPEARRLFCARAPLGWRPLLWCHIGGIFAFATEPRALVVGLALDRRLNEGAIAEFLSMRFVSQTDTFWQGIERLPQGSALVFEGGQIRQWHWHDGPFEDHSKLSDIDHIDRFNALFDQALIASTRSNTPVSAQLSGGLDSSSVVCRLTELHLAGKVAEPFTTYSARFPGEPHDETKWSASVERHLGITARVTTSAPYDFESNRQWCAETLQLPLRPNVFDGPNAMYQIVEASGSRVILTGEGGDDWMDGTFAHLADLAHDHNWRGLLDEVGMHWPDRTLPGRLARTAKHSLLPVFSQKHRRALLLPHLQWDKDVPDWITPAWAKQTGLSDRTAAVKPAVDFGRYAQTQRYGTYAFARRHVNWDNVIAKVERHGIEFRHPMHDLRLTEFLMGARGAMLRRNGRKKHILREAMQNTLPEDVRNRRDKAHLVAPMIDALITRFAQSPPTELRCAKLGWVDGKVLGEIHEAYRQWRENGSVGPMPAMNLAPVWNAVAIDLWLENAFGMKGHSQKEPSGDDRF
jgi:asparagine synthase (glutamine-hydrolysing)